MSTKHVSIDSLQRTTVSLYMYTQIDAQPILYQYSTNTPPLPGRYKCIDQYINLNRQLKQQAIGINCYIGGQPLLVTQDPFCLLNLRIFLRWVLIFQPGHSKNIIPLQQRRFITNIEFLITLFQIFRMVNLVMSMMKTAIALLQMARKQLLHKQVVFVLFLYNVKQLRLCFAGELQKSQVWSLGLLRVSSY